MGAFARKFFNTLLLEHFFVTDIFQSIPVRIPIITLLQDSWIFFPFSISCAEEMIPEQTCGRPPKLINVLGWGCYLALVDLQIYLAPDILEFFNNSVMDFSLSSIFHLPIGSVT